MNYRVLGHSRRKRCLPSSVGEKRGHTEDQNLRSGGYEGGGVS